MPGGDWRLVFVLGRWLTLLNSLSSPPPPASPHPLGVSVNNPASQKCSLGLGARRRGGMSKERRCSPTLKSDYCGRDSGRRRWLHAPCEKSPVRSTTSAAIGVTQVSPAACHLPHRVAQLCVLTPSKLPQDRRSVTSGNMEKRLACIG